MVNRNNDYTIADVSKDDITIISELEKSLSAHKNTDIVLIAYQKEEHASQFTWHESHY